MSHCAHVNHRTVGYLDNEPVPWCQDCGAYKHEHLWVRPTLAIKPCTHPDGAQLAKGAYVYYGDETQREAERPIMTDKKFAVTTAKDSAGGMYFDLPLGRVKVFQWGSSIFLDTPTDKGARLCSIEETDQFMEALTCFFASRKERGA